MSAREEVAAMLRSAAEALEHSAAHCRLAAEQVKAGDIPGMAAHALAARGDLIRGADELDTAAQLHARHSTADRP
jgi:hypothetical protein